MMTLLAIGAAIAVLLWPTPKAPSVPALPSIPTGPVLPSAPTTQSALAALAVVRKRLNATASLRDHEKTAIETLTLAVVAGGDDE